MGSFRDNIKDNKHKEEKMKKFKIGLIILSLFISTNIVKAEEETYYQIEVINYNYNNFKNIKYNNKELRDYFLSLFNNQSNYNYYVITIDYSTYSPNNPIVNFVMFNEPQNGFPQSNTDYSFSYNQNIEDVEECSNCSYTYSNNSIIENNDNMFSWEVYNNYYYGLIDTNYNFISARNYTIENLIETAVDIDVGKTIPSMYSIENPSNYTEINLDNYEYVLLSLKNYNQTQAFQTNLQVKGQIGITPIYNFGQTSKDSITGVQVQDRCNISYDNYTSYPFYIIQSDLQNNAIYAVKECSQASSFKFDNTIFDITYITTENKDNPTVTIGGKTYDVIPYEDLPSTATKNEEDNYIPGESGSASDTGGLDSAIAGAQKKMSEIWNSITYFTDFISQIFSSLPDEIHTILISAFIIMVMLGIIKIFLGK